ncbi:hypothetical protein R1sor_022652 [Riccia sorocarpa]|uniref:F-box domain-containing protein n=1 Tax=Riccia sorocarpa TaxID=122646 RepID=A0ABD3GM85_9MARC
MDLEVWKHLLDHEDILRLILARVSWDTNLRLRSVSKAFYATLSEPSLFTWSSMLTDTSFYTDGVDGDFEDHHLVQSHADAVCLFSTSQSVTYALVDFELHRWCKLPPLGDLPFGNLNDFTVTRVAEGRLLLERTMSEGIRGGDGPLHELDRFLFNPLTRRFIKLPVVPKSNVVHFGSNLKRSLQIFIVVVNELVTVVAVDFYSQRQPELPRILIWRLGSSEDWEIFTAYDPTILPADNMVLDAGSTTNVVFVGGELFLHVLTYLDGVPGDGIFSFGSPTCRIDVPALIWRTGPAAYLYLFQHKGLLKFLELDAGKWNRGYLTSVYTLDRSSRRWQQEEIVEMPRHMYSRRWSLAEAINMVVVGVLGDILCLRNRREPSIFVLFNFQSKQWYRCYAEELVDDGDFDHTKLCDSRLRIPYGRLSDFTVSGVAQGLLLLARKIHRNPISHLVTEYALNPYVD